MPSPIPDEWRYTPPETLVTGDGPYAVALASVLGTVAVSSDRLLAGPEPNAAGGYPRALKHLKRGFLVVPETTSPADAIRSHQAVWDWIEKLSAAGPEHEVAFLLVAPPHEGDALRHAIAVWLGLNEAELAEHGHAVCEMGIPLAELLAVLSSVAPCDRVRLLNRRKADLRRRALAGLAEAVGTVGEGSVIQATARAVADLFKGSEHDLDLFCQPPSHANGNRLRSMVKKLVTEPVTPEFAAECATHLPQLLS